MLKEHFPTLATCILEALGKYPVYTVYDDAYEFN
jgi:hypothetical protein